MQIELYDLIGLQIFPFSLPIPNKKSKNRSHENEKIDHILSKNRFLKTDRSIVTQDLLDQTIKDGRTCYDTTITEDKSWIF